MRTTVKVVRLTLIGSAPLLMVSGMVLRHGGGDKLGVVHALLGLVLSLSLWTIAGAAARAGVSIRTVTLAVCWSLVAIALGVTQEVLLTGSSHWVVQVLHGVTSIGMVAWGQGLVLLMRRAGARRVRSAAPTSGTEASHRSAPVSR